MNLYDMQSFDNSIKNTLDLGESKLRQFPAPYSDPLIEAEILLSYVLKVNKSYLFAHPEVILENEQVTKYLMLINERTALKPISQIIGYKEFYSRIFYVNEFVLTPRPETEFIIDAVCKEFANYSDQPLSVCDIGTGSGCIAITLAEELTKLIGLTIYAYDNSQKALKIARKNWKRLRKNVSANIHFIKQDILNDSPKQKFNLIVSNPPYIPIAKLNTVAEDVLKWEPHDALFAENNGLIFYERIKEIADSNLLQNGIVILEIYPENLEKIRAIFSKYSSNIINDYCHKARVIIFKKN